MWGPSLYFQITMSSADVRQQQQAAEAAAAAEEDAAAAADGDEGDMESEADDARTKLENFKVYKINYNLSNRSNVFFHC